MMAHSFGDGFKWELDRLIEEKSITGWTLLGTQQIVVLGSCRCHILTPTHPSYLFTWWDVLRQPYQIWFPLQERALEGDLPYMAPFPYLLGFQTGTLSRLKISQNMILVWLHNVWIKASSQWFSKYSNFTEINGWIIANGVRIRKKTFSENKQEPIPIDLIRCKVMHPLNWVGIKHIWYCAGLCPWPVINWRIPDTGLTLFHDFCYRWLQVV